jgi:hypothetical protein
MVVFFPNNFGGSTQRRCRSLSRAGEQRNTKHDACRPARVGAMIAFAQAVAGTRPIETAVLAPLANGTF